MKAPGYSSSDHMMRSLDTDRIASSTSWLRMSWFSLVRLAEAYIVLTSSTKRSGLLLMSSRIAADLRSWAALRALPRAGRRMSIAFGFGFGFGSQFLSSRPFFIRA